MGFLLMFYTCVIRKKGWFRISCALLTFVLLIAGLSIFQQKIISAVDEEKEISVPILMYHSILDNARVGETFVLSTQLFHEDMKYLKQNGYTSIFVSDLVDYVFQSKPLPEKPIIITFDDGYLNNLANALPILEEMDMKAVISVIGTNSEIHSKTIDTNLTYAHLSWDEIKKLLDSGRIQIGNHTYNMHKNGDRKGCRKKSGECAQQYQAALRNDIGKLQELLKNNVGMTPEVFAYPFGACSPESVSVLKEFGIKAALTCEEKINHITSNDPEKLYRLGRFNRPGGISTETFMKKLVEQNK